MRCLLLHQAPTPRADAPTASSDRCRTWPLGRPRGSLGGACGFWRLSTDAAARFAPSMHRNAPVIDIPHKPQTLGLRPGHLGVDDCTKSDTKRARARRGEKRVNRGGRIGPRAAPQAPRGGPWCADRPRRMMYSTLGVGGAVRGLSWAAGQWLGWPGPRAVSDRGGHSAAAINRRPLEAGDVRDDEFGRACTGTGADRVRRLRLDHAEAREHVPHAGRVVDR